MLIHCDFQFAGDNNMSFLIQNCATRESLKHAFENLFAKYDKEFTDDDEIDLSDLSLVKKGHHLSRLSQKQNFGCVFRRPSYTSSTIDNHQEILRHEKKLEILKTSNLATSKSDGISKCRKDQFNRSSFDMLLWRLILLEGKSKNILKKNRCKCGLCFDCILYLMDNLSSKN